MPTDAPRRETYDAGMRVREEVVGAESPMGAFEQYVKIVPER